MLGPLLGGILLDHFWWGSVFLIGAPVMLLFLVLGPLLLPEFKDPGVSRMDLFSALLSLVAILSVIYGIKHIAENARLEMVSVITIIAGLILAVVFIKRQQRLADPLIDLRLFRITAFRSTLVALLISLFCWSGLYLFIAQYLQLVLDKDPLRAGLWTIPAAAVSMAGCMLAPATVRRIRRGYMMAIGMTIMSAGLFMLSQIQITLGLPYLVAASIILSFGCGITVTLGVDMVVATAPPERAGAAAGLYETSTTLGTALGVAILGSIGTAVYRGRMGAAVSNLPVEVARAAKGTLGGALAVAGQMPGSPGTVLLSTAREAFVQSMRFSATVAAVLLITTAVVTAVLLGRGGVNKN
jgi:DHA2 family multidrug resistance protein-like MFS transporter